MRQSPSPSRLTIALSLTLAALASCSSSSDDGGAPPTTTATLNSLSGVINAPGGAALPGATIDFESRTATTDASGAFIIPMIGELPTGSYLVGIDGSTATATGTFPALEVVVEVTAGDTNIALPQVVTLPNLENAAAGNQSVGVDASGATTDPIALVSPSGDIGLTGPAGTVIRINGALATGNVALNMTPVPAGEVPMPLPDGLLASSFVTIQPGNSRFEGMDGGGLDVTLPNDGDLPVGTPVDIWSFDHDVGDWVNRTEETGNAGTVVELTGGGTAVQATGVITEGGWHGPVVPIDIDCATTVVGRVIDTEGMPLDNITISTTLGQFGGTMADGTFSIPLVPAYLLSALPNCETIGFDVRAVTAPILGSVISATESVAAVDVVPGGETNVGDIVLDVPNLGCVTGIVNGEPVDMYVTIEGPTNTMIPLNGGSSFAYCGLEPGSYMACILFSGETERTCVPFTVTASGIATVVLQPPTRGGGDGNVTVRVQQLGFDPTVAGDPIPMAQVLLQDSSGGSGGSLMITDANGEARFTGVTAPYDITAWAEIVLATGFGNNVFRQASTIVDLTPTGDVVTVTLLGSNTLGGGTQPNPDATLSGSINNNKANCPVRLSIESVDGVGTPQFFTGQAGLTTQYSIPVLSGTAYEVVATVECPGGNTVTSSASFLMTVPALAAEETRTLDIDLSSPDFVPFDVPLAVTINNAMTSGEPAHTADITIGDVVSGISETFSLVNFETGGGMLPSTWDLPNLSSGPFSGLPARYSYSVSSNFGLSATNNQSIGGPLASPVPASLTLDLLSPPALTTPMSPVTVPDLSGMTFAFTPPSTPAGTSGFETMLFSGAQFDIANPKEAVIVFWTVAMPQGTAGFTFPSVAEQILGVGSFGGSAGAVRATGPAFNFDMEFTNSGLGTLFGSLGINLGDETYTSSQTGFQLQVN